MKLAPGLSALAVALLAGYPAMPASAANEAEEHAAHHPASPVALPAPAGYDQQMKKMQEMHQQMAAAKSPEERAALMKDHMRAMQDGMGMMDQMRGAMMGGKAVAGGKSAMPMDASMMRRRMDMMDMMMQMMMDREAMKAAAPQ